MLQVHPEDSGIGLTTHIDLGRNDSESQREELELQILERHFRDGKIRLRCVGTIFNLYNKTSEEFIGERFKPKSQKQNSMYSRNSGGHGATKFDTGKNYN